MPVHGIGADGRSDTRMGDPSRIQVREYPGGHMFYSRPDSRAALKKDVQDLFLKH